MSRRLASCSVLARREVARDTVVLSFGIELDAAVLPGQFAMVHPGDDHRYVLPRPFSILDYSEGRLDLLVKVAGRGSAEIAAFAVGDRARLLAPLGSSFDAARLAGHPVILVAGGVGIVPLHLLSRRLREHGAAQVRPLFGARTPGDLPMDLLGEDAAGPWQLWVEEQRQGGMREGRVTVGLEEALDTLPDAVVATCGPTPMMQTVARICRSRQVPVWLCLEEQMGCGAGVCRACVVEDAHEERMRTVCHDGPVFSLEDIVYLPEDRPQAGADKGCVA